MLIAIAIVCVCVCVLDYRAPVGEHRAAPSRYVTLNEQFMLGRQTSPLMVNIRMINTHLGTRWESQGDHGRMVKGMSIAKTPPNTHIHNKKDCKENNRNPNIGLGDCPANPT